MLVIDRSFGEGGGQVLRTSLALSLVTGKSFRTDRIRGSRPKPGLRQQHLTAVNAAAQVGCAEITGNELGATTLTFSPQTVQAGTYHFTVATAGSSTLVLQTVLPALMLTDRPSNLTLQGGTRNPLAPTFDFLQHAFLPRIQKAEKVTRRAITEMREYLQSDVPVGRHLADQLLLPLALTGSGHFRTLSPTEHTRTNIAVIQQFLDVAITVQQHSKQVWQISL